jgi:hypothetical protein
VIAAPNPGQNIHVTTPNPIKNQNVIGRNIFLLLLSTVRCLTACRSCEISMLKTQSDERKFPCRGVKTE